MFRWVVRFFDRWLNTPVTVVIVLVLVLAVNGFLLYRQATPIASTPPIPPANRADATTASPEARGSPEESGGPALDTPPPPAASEAPVLPGSLEESMRGCEGDRQECAREFVAEAAPEARYVGGRVDLNTSDLGQNKEVLYFEDPTLEACQHTEQEYEANDGLTYAVIVVGHGSFDSERGSQCIPQA